MDATKYSNLVHYLRDKEYPEGASKREKGVLRRLSKQFTFDVQSGSLFYVSFEQWLERTNRWYLN